MTIIPPRLRAPLPGQRVQNWNKLVASSFRVDDDEVEMKLRVVCYSGRKEDERPIRFQLADREYFVEEVVDQWYGPDDTFFKVRACDGNLYVLRRRSSTPDGEWSLESFRDLAQGR